MDKPRSIDDLMPAPYNARDITPESFEGLGESMARFGDISGITWNATTGRIVCGHQRVKKLRELGAQMVDGALQLANGRRFGIHVVHMTEAEEKAANVTANNPHIAGTFTDDLEPLLRELEGSLGEQDFGALALDALLKQAAKELSFPDDDPAEEPDSELAAVEVKCSRHDLPHVVKLLAPIRDDDRFTLNIS